MEEEFSSTSQAPEIRDPVLREYGTVRPRLQFRTYVQYRPPFLTLGY